MANWQKAWERGGVAEYRLRITPEGARPRYAYVYAVAASGNQPAEYQAQAGDYITKHASIEAAMEYAERDPQVAAFLAAQQANKGE